MDTKCLFPLNHINFKVDGRMNCCFRGLYFDEVQKGDVRGFWNSEQLKKIRLNGLKGVQSPECEVCWKEEAAGKQSFRQSSFDKDSPAYSGYKRIPEVQPDGSLSYEVWDTEIYFSNASPSQNRTSNPRFNSNWAKDARSNSKAWSWLVDKGYNVTLQEDWDSGVHSYDKILTFLNEQAPHLQRVAFSGGEPLANPQHLEALKILEPYASRIRLKYTTSLETLPEEVLTLWKKFQSIRLDIQLDGDRETYNYIHHGAQLENVEKNILRIQENFAGLLGGGEGGGPMQLFGFYTISVYNVHRFVSVVRLMLELGVVFHSRILKSPEFLSVQILPREIKEKIKADLQLFLWVRELPMPNKEIWGISQVRHVHINRIGDQIIELCKYMLAKDSDLLSDFTDFETHFNADKSVSERPISSEWNSSGKLSIEDFKDVVIIRPASLKSKDVLRDTSHAQDLAELKSRASEITLKYVSTLDSLPEDVLTAWENFKSVHIEVPLLGDRETYAQLGREEEFFQIEKNIKRIQEKFKDRLGSEVDEGSVALTGICTVSAKNIARIIPILRSITELGLIFDAKWSHTLLPHEVPRHFKEQLRADLNLLLWTHRYVSFPNHFLWQKEPCQHLQRGRIFSRLKEMGDYLLAEETSPFPALVDLPMDNYAASYLEQPAPILYPFAFFDADISDDALHLETLRLLRSYAPKTILRYTMPLKTVSEEVLNEWFHFKNVKLEAHGCLLSMEEGQAFLRFPLEEADPLRHPFHLETLHIFTPVKAQVHLQYVTPLDFLPEEVLTSWLGFQFTELDIVMDGASKAALPILNENIMRVQKKFLHHFGILDGKITMYGFCQIDLKNINQAVPLVQQMAELGLVIKSYFSEEPGENGLQNLPRSEKLKIKRQLYQYLADFDEYKVNENGMWIDAQARRTQRTRVFNQFKAIARFMLEKDPIPETTS